MADEHFNGMIDALNAVKDPSSHPIGAPGSVRRELNDLGNELVSLRSQLSAAERTRDDFKLSLHKAEEQIATLVEEKQEMHKLIESIASYPTPDDVTFCGICDEPIDQCERDECCNGVLLRAALSPANEDKTKEAMG